MEYQKIQVHPVTTAIGAEIAGVDLSETLDNHTADEIHRAFLDHQVIFFRDQHITPDQQKEFARGYGPTCRAIARDNLVGRFLFRVWKQTEVHPQWARSLQQTLEAEQALPLAKRHGHLALWGMLTGDSSYSKIARDFLHPKLVGPFVVNFLSEYARILKRNR